MSVNEVERTICCWFNDIGVVLGLGDDNETLIDWVIDCLGVEFFAREFNLLDGLVL